MLTDGAVVRGWAGLGDDLFTCTLVERSIHLQSLRLNFVSYSAVVAHRSDVVSLLLAPK